jgi:hypothetical protein
MPSPRWLARLAIPMMAGAALVSSAAIATAANPDDEASLAKLRAVGLTWPPGRKRHSSGRPTSSATTSLGIGRHNRLPTTSTPT